MTPLHREIAAMIAENGPISLEQFISIAATHPRHGYYTSRVPIGARGDFITAPEVHQMFGELIGLWAADVWQTTGESSELRLIELGPGRGTLMADFLRAARIVPAFHKSLDVHLVEAGKALIALQREALAAAGVPITWHESIETLPRGPAIIIANEFFDALPVRHYVLTHEGWHERLVGINDQYDLILGLAPAAVAAPPLASNASLPKGAIVEISLVAQRLMGELAGRIAAEGGAMLVIDYGHVESRPGATLQAVKNHTPVDPLQDPGEVDLTAHVDFAALARAAVAAGAKVHGPVEQGTFLARLGLFQRATALKRNASDAQSAAIDAALARLALPGPTTGPNASMAQLFKALAVSAPSLDGLPGFTNTMARQAS